MIEGSTFHQHIDRFEGMLKEIQSSDSGIYALLATPAEQISHKKIAGKATSFVDALEKEVAYLQTIFDAGDASSIDAERLTATKDLIASSHKALQAEKNRFGGEASAGHQRLEALLEQANFLAEALPTLKDVTQRLSGKQSTRTNRRRQMVARRRKNPERRDVREEISDVIDFVKQNKEMIFTAAKSGQIYYRQNTDAGAAGSRTSFRHSFQVLNIATAASPDEMVVVVHQKPEEKVTTRKGKETNVRHIGLGGEKTVKKSVMVQLSTEKTAPVAVATSRQDVTKGMELVDKERKTLEALAGKPGIIQLKGHAVYRVKKKDGASDPPPEKMNMVLTFADSDLRGLLRKGRLTETARQNFTLELLTGLVEVHKAGFIHYDIKIDNIFVVNGSPKIGDFGSSEKVGTPVIRRGTRSSVPPEMHRLIEASKYKRDLTEEQLMISPRMDVFEMGIVLFIMKYGMAPEFSKKIHAMGREYEKESKKEDFERYAKEIENWHAEASPQDDEDAIILSMLAPNPNDRPTAEKALDQLKSLYRRLI